MDVATPGNLVQGRNRKQANKLWVGEMAQCLRAFLVHIRGCPVHMPWNSSSRIFCGFFDLPNYQHTRGAQTGKRHKFKIIKFKVLFIKKFRKES